MKSILTFLTIALTSTAAVGFESTESIVNLQTQTQESPQEELPSESDPLRATVQGICPVSGEKLGSMGSPIKVKAGQQELFLCCDGCKGKPLNPEHWKAVKTNLAAAQKLCPIMEKPVNAEMKSTIVDGQLIFVCCPPCIEKIQADVEAAMTIVNANYKEYVTAKQQVSNDRLQIAAQRICPVSGEKLGSMGAPIKVKVGPEETAFLCCKACVGKKIEAALWKTVQGNLAKSQGACPVTGKPLTDDMKSTVVHGRKIFVCCPDCLAEIQAKPIVFITKVNLLIERNVVKPMALESAE